MKQIYRNTIMLMGAALMAAHLSAQESIQLAPIVVEGDPKTTGSLSQQPLSYSAITTSQLQEQGTNSLKSAAQFVPNLFIPDYGSRLTSAIYIRGVGSRLNTPSVGLYVDDVAFKEKSAFDISFNDVQRVEVLRGPQSTLYGRNAMGGLLKLYTFNPLDTRWRGRQTVIRAGASTEDAGRYVNFRTAAPVGENAAYSFAAFYEGNDGYNRNTFLNRKSNGGDAGGVKFRYVYNPVRHPGFTADFQTSVEYSDENGYDYFKVADLNPDEIAAQPGNAPNADNGIGQIRESELGSYRRMLFNNSLKLQSVQKHFTLTSVTGYQFLTDRMFMDQDFSPANLFTLEQRQRSHYLSEELVAKSRRNRKFEWVGGVYVAQQWLKTNAPVVFGREGIEQFIQNGINQGFAAANEAMNPMGMNIDLQISDQKMTVNGLFDTPSFNAAAFGQATLKNLLPHLNLTAGVRVDYEHNKLDYNSVADINYAFVMTRRNIPMINTEFTTTSGYQGVIKKDYTQVLPKVALTYELPDQNMIYASVSKGFRSGGYNIQMFSDLIQASMRNDMMADLAADPTIGGAMARYNMTPGENPSADSTTVFKPETSWNFELGTHLNLFDGRLTLNAAAFYIRTVDQQIARFAANGLGRQMVNAGKSESCGAEISAGTWFHIFRNPLTLNLSYGFTNAKFIEYAGDAVYDDNYVPFVPRHTVAAAAEYMFSVKRVHFNIGANVTGAGRTYWTESNSASEPFYLLLGAHVGARYKNVAINIWGKNLTDKQYVPFYFESLSQGLAQTCRPRQFGIDLTITL